MAFLREYSVIFLISLPRPEWRFLAGERRGCPLAEERLGPALLPTRAKARPTDRLARRRCRPTESKKSNTTGVLQDKRKKYQGGNKKKGAALNSTPSPFPALLCWICGYLCPLLSFTPAPQKARFFRNGVPVPSSTQSSPHSGTQGFGIYEILPFSFATRGEAKILHPGKYQGLNLWRPSEKGPDVFLPFPLPPPPHSPTTPIPEHVRLTVWDAIQLRDKFKARFLRSV